MGDNMKKALKVIVILVLSISCLGCSKKEVNLLGIDFNRKNNEAKLDYKTSNPVVAMEIEDYGAIVMELYPNKAENTVNNFISLVKSGFYDNNSFHRLVPDFVLQGGDPKGTGSGGPGYKIKGEFKNNGYSKNDIKHKKKIVSMARGQDNDSAGSQFFIMLGDSASLDGDYAAFGKVIDGYKVIENIEDDAIVEDNQTGKLRKNIVIKKALVDTKDYKFMDVEKIDE